MATIADSERETAAGRRSAPQGADPVVRAGRLLGLADEAFGRLDVGRVKSEVRSPANIFAAIIRNWWTR
jgi:hypothetical protein